MAKLEDFKIVCKTCGGEDVKITTYSTGDIVWASIECVICGTNEEVTQ